MYLLTSKDAFEQRRHKRVAFFNDTVQREESG
jgi:hypothetical protein